MRCHRVLIERRPTVYNLGWRKQPRRKPSRFRPTAERLEDRCVPTITASPVSGIEGTEGTPLVNVQVATFIETDTAEVASDFTASVDWGDGTPPTPGTVTFVSPGPTG